MVKIEKDRQTDKKSSKEMMMKMKTDRKDGQEGQGENDDENREGERGRQTDGARKISSSYPVCLHPAAPIGSLVICRCIMGRNKLLSVERFLPPPPPPPTHT